MDISSAIVAHAQWKDRLHRVIASTETVDPQVVARDDVCPLGQWIHGPQSRTALSAQAHARLREAHAEFHATASSVAAAALDGRQEEARARLGVEGDFTRTSTWVVRILDRLRAGDESTALQLQPVQSPPDPDFTVAPVDRRRFIAFALGLGAFLFLMGLLLRTVPGGAGGTVLALVIALALGTAATFAGVRMFLSPVDAILRSSARRLGISVSASGPQLAEQVCAAMAHDRAQADYRHEVSASLIAASAANISAVSSQLTDRTSGAREQSDSVSASTERINDVVAGISRTVEEMSSSLSQVSTSIDSGAQLARAVQEAVALSEAQTRHLETSAASVSHVVEMIVGIAAQTNMLALNATIEAARAGDVGKGFAVVASEVKDLAQATESATAGITDQVQQIQHAAATMLATFETLDAQVHELNAQQSDMSTTVRAQSDAVASISSRANAAAADLTGVTSEVGDLSTTVAATDQVAGVALSTANEMQALALELAAQVRQGPADAT